MVVLHDKHCKMRQNLNKEEHYTSKTFSNRYELIIVNSTFANPLFTCHITFEGAKHNIGQKELIQNTTDWTKIMIVTYKLVPPGVTTQYIEYLLLSILSNVSADFLVWQ